MTPAFSAFVAVAVFSVGRPCNATPVLAAQALFPTDRAPTPSGASLLVSAGRAVQDKLRISPVTFLSRPGTNAGEGSKSMCGLVIAAPGRGPQGVITVGTGVTEATPSCDSIIAVGVVPASTGEGTSRIGVIHAVSSRNAANGRTAVVLHRDSGGTWSVDADATARVDAMTEYTIAGMRRRLGRR